MNETLQKLTAARTRLILDKPFLGALVLRLPLQSAPVNWCPTVATDAKALFYNPEYIAPLTLHEVQFVLAHEALHCGLSHFARREHRNRRRWDVACDHSINQMLVDDGLTPPSEALLNSDYSGMTAEEIYPLIPDDTDEEPLDQHLYDGLNNGDNDSSDNDDTIDGDIEQNPDPTADAQQSQTIQQPPPLSAQERDELQTQWQQRLVGAAQQATQAGKISDSIGRLVNRLIHSSVPWRTLLARFMSNSTRTDYNLLRPSQRREGDAIHPSLYSPSTDVVVALDTSGSIDDDELNAFVTEVNAIKGLVNARVTLLACDADLDPEGPWVFEAWQQLEFPGKLSGDGGTDFRPVFSWLHMQSIKPDLLIYFTDAVGRFPDNSPLIETLWLVKGSARIPWGQRIQLN